MIKVTITNNDTDTKKFNIDDKKVQLRNELKDTINDLSFILDNNINLYDGKSKTITNKNEDIYNKIEKKIINIYVLSPYYYRKDFKLIESDLNYQINTIYSPTKYQINYQVFQAEDSFEDIIDMLRLNNIIVIVESEYVDDEFKDIVKLAMTYNKDTYIYNVKKNELIKKE